MIALCAAAADLLLLSGLFSGVPHMLWIEGTREDPSDVRRLVLGQRIDREIGLGETHSYELLLDSNQYFHLKVEDESADLLFSLTAPDGTKLLESMEGPSTILESKAISELAQSSGSYRLQLRSSRKEGPPGRYAITADIARTATAEDKKRIEAGRIFREAERLRQEGTVPRLRESVAKYEHALELVRQFTDREGEGKISSILADIYEPLGDLQKALQLRNRVLLLARALGDQKGEATALNKLGLIHRLLGELEKALDYYQQAVAQARATGDSGLETMVLNNVATVYSRLGEPDKALDIHNQVLPIVRGLGQRRGEAAILNNIGQVYSSIGEPQKALDFYNQALPIRRLAGDQRGEAYTLDNIGATYSTLGDPKKALDLHHQALKLERAIGDRRGEAVTLYSLGMAHRGLGEFATALEFFNEAIQVSRAVGERQGEPASLNQIGLIYNSLGEKQKAEDAFNKALVLARSTSRRALESWTLTNLGLLHIGRGDPGKALEFYKQALPLLQAIGEHYKEARQRGLTARAELELGDLAQARSNIEAALSTMESMRGTISRDEVRTSYSASIQDYYDTYIEVLMRLHRRYPGQGYDAMALETSERARARTLLESLAESAANIREGVDDQLLELERSLHHRLNAKAERQVQLLSGRHTPDQAEALAKEIENLTLEYQDVQAKIRATSPRYAALTQPEPLTLQAIRDRVLDPETLLLEYALAKKQSYLWVASTTNRWSYELAPEPEIETAARRFYNLLKSEAREHEINAAAADLSQMLLGPVAEQLGSRRLLIVGHGALQYVPFAALPDPTAQGANVPMIVKHEIISVPSASVLAQLRRENAERKRAEKVLAVLADPVFTPDDPRVTRARQHKNNSDKRSVEIGQVGTLTPPLSRAMQDTSPLPAALPRLLGTRREAAAVLALVPKSKRLEWLDFDANRGAASSGALEHYQIIHLATHGYLNVAHPELSGIVLSCVNKRGEPEDGFLRLHELYNLRLRAELVVLSACQTALGKQIRGEGLVGLTRGFFYAGTSRVLASLWKVDDTATTELMKRFYRALLIGKDRPAAALRAAQIAMWKERSFRSPANWAGFVLQGEWQ